MVTTSDLTESPGRIAIAKSDAPDYQAIKRVIRNFLKYDFAEQHFGLAPREVPTRLSTYSGKGPGHYQTAPDGRAEWDPRFAKYIFESSDRAIPPQHRFGVTEFVAVMERLRIAHPRWHAITIAYDVEGQTMADVCDAFTISEATVHRLRREVVHYLFPLLYAPRAGTSPQLRARYVPIDVPG